MSVLMGLRENLRLSRLHLITDVGGDIEDFRLFVHRMYDAGVDIIQVRDTRTDRDFVRRAVEAAVQPAFDHRALLCVGHDLKLADAIGADLLQVDENQLEDGRARLRAEALVGCAVDSLAEARQAHQRGADWVSFGRVAGPDARGLETVRALAEAFPGTDEKAMPWFAVGGITLENLDEVLAAGATRVAVSTAILKADDPVAVAREFSRRLREHFETLPGADGFGFRVLGGPSRTATLGDPPPVPQGTRAPGASTPAASGPLVMPLVDEDLVAPQVRGEGMVAEVPDEGDGQVSEVGSLRAPRKFTTEAPGE